jgi:hypothetical protein
MENKTHAHVEHEHSLLQELLCHFPYATFSVAVGFLALSLLKFFGTGCTNMSKLYGAYHLLFHSFHYVHILFATVGTVVTFLRFSPSIARCILVSLLSPAIFCTLSDVALPTLAARILGIRVPLHICFFSLPDTMNVLPFMLMGLITGFMIARHHTHELRYISLHAHFIHILISAFAASCYIASYGFDAWQPVMGMLFCFMVVAVVVPCTISDVIIPMYVARCK